MAVKVFTVGAVQKKKSGEGSTIQLGNYSSNPKYATSVEIIVRDGAGNVMAQADSRDKEKYPSGLYLQVKDPRQRTGITEDQAAKIPEWKLFELALTTVTKD